jgi:hypothetical protein
VGLEAGAEVVGDIGDAGRLAAEDSGELPHLAGLVHVRLPEFFESFH